MDKKLTREEAMSKIPVYICNHKRCMVCYRTLCGRTVDKEFAELDENGEPIIADYYVDEEVNLAKDIYQRGLNDAISDVAYILDVLIAYRNIIKTGNCNDCGKRKDCEYVPKWGEQVRINCPLYKKKVEK